MRLPPSRLGLVFGSFLAVVVLASEARAADEGWIDLIGSSSLDAWKPPTSQWAFVDAVRPDPANPKRLVGEPGTGVLYNGTAGKAPNLVTREEFSDAEVHLEFLVPKGSNSGIKFGGVY